MSQGQRPAGDASRRVTFSSDDLPGALSEAQRRERIFDDVFGAMGGASDFVLGDGLAVARVGCLAFEKAAVVRAEANVSRWRRTARHIATDPQDSFHLGLNTSATVLAVSQRGEDVAHAPRQPLLFSTAEPLDVRARAGGLNTLCLSISAEPLRERVEGVEDLLLAPIRADNPTLRHLWRYAGWLLDADEVQEKAQFARHIETMLIDLAALVLGAEGESAEIAGQRGLRLARLQEILAAIREGYASPGFGPAVLAKQVGLSPRYIQELLQGTGRSFSDRVMELRLQHARRMLASARFADLRIIDIAMASGFNDVSYFNRCFRRRYGLRPTAVRGRREV